MAGVDAMEAAAAGKLSWVQVEERGAPVLLAPIWACRCGRAYPDGVAKCALCGAPRSRDKHYLVLR